MIQMAFSKRLKWEMTGGCYGVSHMSPHWSPQVAHRVAAGADGILLERSVMKEDEKWGWVYSGESKKDEWL